MKKIILRFIIMMTMSLFAQKQGDIAFVGYNGDGDDDFATLGNPATDSVTIWLAGIEFRKLGQGTNFAKTGLEIGTNYLVINDTQSKDGGQYTGTRTEKTVSEYRTLINNEENWTTETSNGESILPFDLTTFQFEKLSININTIEGLIISVKNQKIITNIGHIISVRNMLGQQILNQNLTPGIYIVTIKNKKVIANYKLAI